MRKWAALDGGGGGGPRRPSGGGGPTAPSSLPSGTLGGREGALAPITGGGPGGGGGGVSAHAPPAEIAKARLDINKAFIRGLFSCRKDARPTGMPSAPRQGKNSVRPTVRTAPRKHSGRRRRPDRSKNVASSIGVRDRGGMNEPAFEAALHRERQGRRDEIAAFALWTGFDERPTASVLKDEFFAEDFSNL